MPALQDKFKAVFMAVMVGDAMGQPVETMTADEILAATHGLGVRDFIDPLQTKLQHGRQLTATDTTDDWQLTEVVARSLIEFGGYDSLGMARAHVAALKATTLGWGGTTRDAIAQIIPWLDTGGKDGRNPGTLAYFPEANRGGGNGVAMKIAPLALWHSISPVTRDRLASAKDLIRDVQRLWLLTHNTAEALYTAFAYAYLMASILRAQQPLSDEEAKHHLVEARQMVREVRVIWPGYAYERTYNQLSETINYVGNPDGLRTNITPGFSAITSIPYAMGIFASFPRDFRKVVLTCVNAGGDSDSTAAMAGALVASNCGLDVIPRKWQLTRYDPGLELGLALYRAATNTQL